MSASKSFSRPASAERPRSPFAASPAVVLISDQREAVGFQLGRDLAGRGLVGVADLDGLEAGLGRRLEAVEQRHLGEQEIQVGAKAGHGCHCSNGGPRCLIMCVIERSLKASMRSTAKPCRPYQATRWPSGVPV